MPEAGSINNEFLQKLTAIIEKNLDNDQFGVSELADKIGMSRSNLLRKIKKLAGVSASRFITQVRLENALKLLRQQSYTVSEVSYKVGFGSTSYFIICFREHYGYPPGEAVLKEYESKKVPVPDKDGNNKRVKIIAWSVIILTIVALVLIFTDPFSGKEEIDDKSIAVLPFINDSEDSSNVHIINGLMEATLGKLQKIEDLRVISRTSVERYRRHPKSIREIARELDVKYFVEGSGQKIGDKIMLSIQLIDGRSDKHLWAEQYERDASDIFNLQNDIARDITTNIKAVITPVEKARLEKSPTDDVVAYELYLKGIESLFAGTKQGLDEAIAYFKSALERDSTFARAYADIGIAYYFMDQYRADKEHTALINHFADQALYYDPELEDALMAKAMFYINSHENELAVPYLKTALEYNPNSAYVIHMLAEFYASHLPDTKEYLRYALKGIRLDIASNDSLTASFIYLHVGNAFIQSGFVDEAKEYLEKSLRFDPSNIYSKYVMAYVEYAARQDLQQLNKTLLKVFALDTTRLDVMQELAKSYYYQRDFNEAYRYYKKFNEARNTYKLDIYKHENAKIGLVLDKVGLKDESDKYFSLYKAYADEDVSIYKHLSLAVYHAFYRQTDKAIDELKLFSAEDHFHYWTIIFLDIDPLVDNIRNMPEYDQLLKTIEAKFWDYHNEIKASLQKENLL